MALLDLQDQAQEIFLPGFPWSVSLDRTVPGPGTHLLLPVSPGLLPCPPGHILVWVLT